MTARGRPDRRNPELVESPEQLAALAAKVRQLAAEALAVEESTRDLSGPAWDQGWTTPVARLRALPGELMAWADRLDDVSRGPSTTSA